MSRIGKKPIVVPKGVTVKVHDGAGSDLVFLFEPDGSFTMRKLLIAAER